MDIAGKDVRATPKHPPADTRPSHLRKNTHRDLGRRGIGDRKDAAAEHGRLQSQANLRKSETDSEGLEKVPTPLTQQATERGVPSQLGGTRYIRRRTDRNETVASTHYFLTSLNGDVQEGKNLPDHGCPKHRGGVLRPEGRSLRRGSLPQNPLISDTGQKWNGGNARHFPMYAESHRRAPRLHSGQGQTEPWVC